MCLDSWGLKFFDSGEWQVLEERYYEEADKITPARGDVFASLDAVSLSNCKVAILGQDPYPTSGYATGIAFDIPECFNKYPPTLLNIFKEYSTDLGHPFPSSGSLRAWCDQGVLLYNVIPTCYIGSPGSHREWTEWFYLSQEVVEKLHEKKILVVALGVFANSFCVHLDPSLLISLSHPSPLAALRGNHPFLGSRVFTTINQKLIKSGKEPIQWKLN